MRDLNRFEDSFLAYNKRNERNVIRTCIAHARMLYDQERMMFSAREYLLHKIEIMRNREQDLNFEISALRAASSSGDNSGKKSGDEVHNLLSALADFINLTSLRIILLEWTVNPS